MNEINIILLLIASIEARQFDITLSYLTEDFIFEGLGSMQSGKQTYRSILHGITTALPDWTINFRNVKPIHGGASATIKLVGTHTGICMLPDMPLIKPTGKKIIMPEKLIEFSIQDDKVCRAKIESRPDTGLPGLLKQMGIQAH